MNNDNITPINHNAFTATSTVAAEAGKSGIKKMLATGVLSPFASTLLGAVAGAAMFGLAAFTVGALFIPVGAVTLGGVAGAALTAAGFGASIGGFSGLVGGTFFAPLIAGFGGLFGLVGGTSRGISKISQEQSAANVMAAQLSAYQAQAMNVAPPAPTVNKYDFPAQGSAFNQASSTINAGSLSNEGPLNAAGLQRA